MKVLFGSANHWTSPYQVGSHAWARLFAQNGWDVAYLSDPLTPWHQLSSQNVERTAERQGLWQSHGEKFENGKVRAWVPRSLIAPQNRPFFRNEFVLRNWHSFATPSISFVLKQWSFQDPDLIWFDSVRHWSWLKTLPAKKKVFRLADWSAGFSSVPQSQLDLEKEILKEADLVITSAEALREKVKDIRVSAPLATIRNAVDTAFWSTACPIPTEYQEIPGPRVVYMGAIEEWFDANLLTALAKAFPKVSFVMVGQRRIPLNGELTLKNIHWLGSRSREQARAYLQHAQVGIIPFKRNDLIECVCPLKLYEYMACDIPVVATRWKELEMMNSPACLASSTEEWITVLKSLLNSNQSHGYRDYAAQNDWSERWNQWSEIYQKL